VRVRYIPWNVQHYSLVLMIHGNNFCEFPPKFLQIEVWEIITKCFMIKLFEMSNIEISHVSSQFHQFCNTFPVDMSRS